VSTETKRPQDLTVGDEFRVPQGPHARRLVRVLEPPTIGLYGNYAVRVAILSHTDIVLDYAAELAVDPPDHVRGGETEQ
jgi:hypothetical protein